MLVCSWGSWWGFSLWLRFEGHVTGCSGGIIQAGRGRLCLYLRGGWIGAERQRFRVHERGGWVLMFGLLHIRGVGMDRRRTFRVSAFLRSGGWALNDGVGVEIHLQAF